MFGFKVECRHIKLAEIFEKSGNPQRALIQYVSAHDVTPDESITLKIISLSISLAECEKAEETVSELPKNHPELVRIYNNLGVCWARKKIYDKARDSWETALRIDPAYGNARENLDQLNDQPL